MEPAAQPASEGRRPSVGVRLALTLLVVAVVCHFATQLGFALKFPPNNISVFWPTNAILFAVLVMAPVRHWWMYSIAAFATSVFNDARAGFPLAALLFLAGDFIEILLAAVGVRRFAGGGRAFASLGSLIVYILIAAVLAPATSAFVGAFAGGPPGYWFNWRVWFLSDAPAYLTLAPAIITGIAVARAPRRRAARDRIIEACLIGVALVVVSGLAFTWWIAGEDVVPTLVYLPLPVLLWAAVRFGPLGVNASLLVVTTMSILGTALGRGPFGGGTPAEHVLALQLFLFVVSVPLMFLAALVEERRVRTNVLRESEARFRAMADTAPVLIWVAGQDRGCTFLNRGWLDFTGRTMAQELGDGWIQGIHPADVGPCVAGYANAFDERREFTREYRLRRHDGEYRVVLDRGVPRFAPDGTFLGYIGCADDITKRKAAELQAQQHRAELAHVARIATLGELSASLAHELNQPLTAILSNAQAAQRLLDAEPIDLAEIREILKDVVADDNRAGQVIQRLRALVKKQPPEFTALDLGAILHEVVHLVHTDAILRASEIALTVAPGLPPVWGDRVELQQVALNLLLNALEAMKERPVEGRQVLVQVEADGPRMVKVAVRDRGTGLGDEIERVFRPFHTTKPDGLGVGLSISRSIVEAHGGRLWAENNPDRGATFSFTIPAARA
jgi:PAS domain S-box-containing protein